MKFGALDGGTSRRYHSNMIRRLLWLMFVAAQLGAQQVPATYEPVPALPGAGRPVDVAATAARRTRLLERLGEGLVLIPAATQRDLEVEVLQDSDFRQDDYFFYLTGAETPDAWLVLAAHRDADDEVFLLLPPRNPRAERWTGRKLGPGKTAARLTGIDVTLEVGSLDSLLQQLSVRTSGPWHMLLAGAGAPGQLKRIVQWTSERESLLNVAPVLDSMRVVKDSAELVRLRRAIEITVEAHKAAMGAVRVGMHEYQLEAVIEYTFRNLGADRLGFPSIVGSGPNSTTLHYDVNRRRMESGDLVVADIGAEYGQYTADVTRTFPVDGRFTQRQKAIYDLVLATQQAAIDAVRPGVTVGELNRIARTYMLEHSGALCGSRTCDEYFIHGLSHWLGMRVHDVGDYSMALEPGMVLTVEPGIYLPDEAIGVRIEDDVLVTADGHEVLSAGAPRTTHEIEALMRGSDRAGASGERL